jgi:hypothetical protein
MTKNLFLANCLLTLPFGIIALAIPGEIFSTFGVTLDTGGQLIARGYAATLVGYGLVFWYLRANTSPEVLRPLLAASTAFNAIETIIQSAAAFNGTVPPIIWSTIIPHLLLTILSAYLLLNRR